MKEFMLINSIIRFLIEIMTMLLLIFIGLTKFKMPFNILIGVVVPFLVFLIWSSYIAPASPNKVIFLYRVFIEIIIFSSTSLLIFAKLPLKYFIIYVVIVAINTFLVHRGELKHE